MDIKTLIAASGKTRTSIIAETGISQAYLSLIENNHRKVGPSFVGPLAVALGVKPQELRPDLACMFTPADKGASA